MGPGSLLVGPTSGPHEYAKLCFGVSHNRCTKTCYMTSMSYMMQKHKFGVTCHGTLLVGLALNRPKNEKYYNDVSHPGRTRMCYVTSRSHGMQKHKFGVTYRGALLLGPASSPPENEKKCVDLSHPGRTRTCYVASRSHGMQKHKFNITCPEVSYGTRTRPTRTRKIVHRHFTLWMPWNALHDLQIAQDAKTQVWRNVSRHTSCGTRTSPPKHMK
jgi:hypothetical protein